MHKRASMTVHDPFRSNVGVFECDIYDTNVIAFDSKISASIQLIILTFGSGVLFSSQKKSQLDDSLSPYPPWRT